MSTHSAAGSSWRSESTVAIATSRWRAVVAIEPSANPTASSSSSASVTRTSERRPLASAVIATIDGRGPVAATPRRGRRRRAARPRSRAGRARARTRRARSTGRRARSASGACPDARRRGLRRPGRSGSATSRTIDTSGSRQISRSTSVRSSSSMCRFFPFGRVRDTTSWRRGAVVTFVPGARISDDVSIRRRAARSARGPRRRVRESKRNAVSAGPDPSPLSPAPRWCRREQRASSATAASRSATRKAARHMPSVFAARGAVSTQPRRSEPGEHDQHFAAARRARARPRPSRPAPSMRR